MRIRKTHAFLGLKIILPVFALLLVGAFAVIRNSSAAECPSEYYICYAATAGGKTVDRYNHDNPISAEGGNDWYAGNGAYALADEGYVFVKWVNESGVTMTTDELYIPCGAQQGCSSSSDIRVQKGETITAVFEREGGGSTPTPATESLMLPVSVESGALEGNESITLSLSDSSTSTTTEQTVTKSTNSVDFGEVTFTETGSHRYRIVVNNSNATAQPDALSLEVKIDASLDAQENKIVTQKTYYKNDSEISESEFVLNISVVQPTPAYDNVSLVGLIDPEADLSDFSVDLIPVGDAPAPASTEGEIIDNTTVNFDIVTFTKPGRYEHDFVFKNGDKTLTIYLVTDVVLDRTDNALKITGGQAYDADGNAITYGDLMEMVAELLAKEQPDDDPDDSGDDSEDGSEDGSDDSSDDDSDHSSSDDATTPDTGDAIQKVSSLAILSFASATALILAIRKVRR